MFHTKPLISVWYFKIRPAVTPALLAQLSGFSTSNEEVWSDVGKEKKQTPTDEPRDAAGSVGLSVRVPAATAAGKKAARRPPASGCRSLWSACVAV